MTLSHTRRIVRTIHNTVSNTIPSFNTKSIIKNNFLHHHPPQQPPFFLDNTAHRTPTNTHPTSPPFSLSSSHHHSPLHLPCQQHLPPSLPLVTSPPHELHSFSLIPTPLLHCTYLPPFYSSITYTLHSPKPNPSPSIPIAGHSCLHVLCFYFTFSKPSLLPLTLGSPYKSISL